MQRRRPRRHRAAQGYPSTRQRRFVSPVGTRLKSPVPVPDPAERAVNMAMAMREEASGLIATWRRRDRDLGFGAGIARRSLKEGG